MLPLNIFRKVVESAPLVALDLIIENNKSEYMVGKRLNAPAKGWLFVPGGRIKKGEAFSDALSRISLNETGHCFDLNEAILLGIYEHFYDDNAFGVEGFGTHYVVLGCKLQWPEHKPVCPDKQHTQLNFSSLAELQTNPMVHPYTLAYFSERPKNYFPMTRKGCINGG